MRDMRGFQLILRSERGSEKLVYRFMGSSIF